MPQEVRKDDGREPRREQMEDGIRISPSCDRLTFLCYVVTSMFIQTSFLHRDGLKDRPHGCIN